MTETYQEWCERVGVQFEYECLSGGVHWDHRTSKPWGKIRKCSGCESRLTAEKLKPAEYKRQGGDGTNLVCHVCDSIVARASAAKYSVSVTFPAGRYATEYTMGSALYLRRPTVHDVMQSLALDSSCYAQSADVKDFCSSLGYEGDSVWDGIAAHDACQSTFKALYQILGGREMDRLMYECGEYCEYCHTGLFGGTCDCDEDE